MKKAFAVVIACIACFALGYYINKESTDKQLREIYQLEYLDAVKELDEDYSERLEKEKEKSYQKGYNIGFAKGLDAGHGKGVSNTLCVVFIIVGVSLVAYFSYKLYIRKMIKRLEEIPSDEIEETKKKLIEGIEDYDRMHGDNQ